MMGASKATKSERCSPSTLRWQPANAMTTTWGPSTCCLASNTTGAMMIGGLAVLEADHAGTHAVDDVRVRRVETVGSGPLVGTASLSQRSVPRVVPDQVMEVVFFDVGGVLLAMDGEERRAPWSNRLGITDAALAQAVWDATELRGKKDMDEVTERLSATLGLPEDDVPTLLTDFSAHWTRNDQLVEFLAGLRDSNRLAIIGNVPSSGRFAFETVLHLDDVFEAMFLSGELGVEKPDRRIYEVACSEMSVSPERALFVDDRAENVQGARAVGMVAHQHVGNDDTIRWLSAHLR